MGCLMLMGSALATEIGDLGEIDVRALPASRKAAPADHSVLWLKTGTRVTALITDPHGRKIGVDPTTYKTVRDVPGGECAVDFVANPYTGDAHAEAYEHITLTPPHKGVYRLVLHGLQTGPYEISAAALSRDGSSEPSKTLEGMITEDEDQTLELVFDPAPHAALSLVNVTGNLP